MILIQGTKRTELETYVMRNNMEIQMIDHCHDLINRTKANVMTCLDRAKQMQFQGIQDLKTAVAMVNEHRENTMRLFGRTTYSRLKRCQVYVLFTCS